MKAGIPWMMLAGLLLVAIGSPRARAAEMHVKGDITGDIAPLHIKVGSTPTEVLTLDASNDVTAAHNLTVTNEVTAQNAKINQGSSTFGQVSAYSVTYGQNTYNGIKIHADSGKNVMITNDGLENSNLDSYHRGLVVSKDGLVGISNWIDALNPMEALHIGSEKGMTLHDGGNKAIFWNGYYDYVEGGQSHCRYLGDDSAAFVYQDYNSDKFYIHTAPAGTAGESIDDDWSYGIVIDTAGKVAIGHDSPSAPLDVNGVIRLRNIGMSPSATPTPLPTVPADFGAIIFAHDGYLKAKDQYGDVTTFSSHEDPRKVAPQAQCSFSDPSIALPFSFHHQNIYLGRGEFIDMARLVAWAEKKMQVELGSEQGRLVYRYDLPKNDCKSIQDYQVALVMDELNSMAPIEVKVGPHGEIPAEAFEEVDEIREVTQNKSVPEKTIDYQSMRVVTTMRNKTVVERIHTGRKVRQLKKEWNFSYGKLCRKPNVNDLDIDVIIKKHPQLPHWIIDRMQTGSQTGKSVSDLISEIKARTQISSQPKNAKQNLAALPLGAAPVR